MNQDASQVGEESDATFHISPGLGIARLGNSVDAYFVGPEAPGWSSEPADGYKDAVARVKRQAARFRIFEYGPKGEAVREVTSFDASIKWTVHLANKKASWFKFVGRYPWADESKRVLRNDSIMGGAVFQANPDLRTELIIDPGPRSITGAHQGPVAFDNGEYRGHPVYLGAIQTDGYGHLMVLGGRGDSASIDPNNPVTNYANNNGWFDDSSDGIVTATITFPNGKSFTAESAWVIVAPPKFAPDLNNLVTLDDLMRQVASDEKWIVEEPVVEFYRDILPILQRACDYAWVNATSYRGHGAPTAGDFLAPELIEQLSDPSSDSAEARQTIFNRLRAPLGEVPEDKARVQASWNYMPLTAGDGGEPLTGDPTRWLSLLPNQYRKLQSWANGDFIVGIPQDLLPLDRIPLTDQPEALDRAALERCVGGPFYPGIEMTFIAADAATWRMPYRVADGTKPGDLTRWMAVPWQADFFECISHWWPVNRPGDVLPEDEYESVLSAASDTQAIASAAAYRVPWARGLPESSPEGDNAMIQYWSELGFVVPTKISANETVYVERQRSPIVGLDPRELFYKLMNIDSFPEVHPKARAYAEKCLEDARILQLAPDTPDIWRPFDYAPETFQALILETYRSLVVDVAKYDPATDPTYSSADDVRERIRQFSPFNMSDGSWLRNITRVGPFDEPRALLFSVLMDEMGDGEVSHNHSNIYRDLCRSIGFYPADCTSAKFAFDETFIDSAFDVPAFELAISQFSDDYYPELLGMTLQLELGIVEAKNTIALIEYYGLDAHYWIMHVGIDNPVNGHAARAIRAIELYLDSIRVNAGGEEAVAVQWARIWDGYVAFGTTGTFGQDFVAHLQSQPSLSEQVADMITRKAFFGSMNHDQNRLAGTPINEWFLDPVGFMKVLVEEGLFIPGDPEKSPFFQLTSFETGRMYRVFTDDELKLWSDWCRSLTIVNEPESPNLAPTAESYSDMVRVIQWIREGGGRDVLTSMQPLLRLPESQPDEPFAQLLREPTRDLLEALAAPASGLVNLQHPSLSTFVASLADGTPVPGHSTRPMVVTRVGRPATDVALDWIADGAPVPPRNAGGVPNLWLESSREEWEAHPTRQILGMGAIH